ncbi:MAG: mannose-1-phosphate guanylyltransferase [Treponema sp.]|nr:mannose-1-phosphate guanylyltransferase [Treponema sp.]
MFNDCIIMAGGAGTRLWPASNSKTPKQFLAVSPEGSFFDFAVERALGIIPAEGDGRVIIVAGKSHRDPVIAACSRLEEAKRKRLILILEPAAKSTAPAIACAALWAGLTSGEDRKMLVLTSDHVIKPAGSFYADAARACAFASRGRLVVFGIPPAAPKTGYGYIEAAEPLALPRENSPGGPEGRVYRAASFREKPDRERAEQYLAAGRFYWNSGMFAFSSRFILEEFKRNAPEVFLPLDKLRLPGEDAYTRQGGLRVLEHWDGLEAAYGAVRNISFDYAIAEKCDNTVMVAAGFDWIDVGSWDEYVKLAGDTGAEVYRSGSSGCFVDGDIPVALCGVEDLIIVVRSGRDGNPPAVLVAKKGETQGVKEIVDKIKAAGRTDLL